MDPEPEIITAVVTAIVTLTGSWLVFRNQATKQRDEQVKTARDESREDFEAIVTQGAETIKRLDERVKRLEMDLDAERKKRLELEQEVARLRLIYRLLRRAVIVECGKGRDCPLWRYLDDQERDQLVASMTTGEAMAETAGGQQG